MPGMEDILQRPLDGQVALISGAAGDIGSAIAQELGRRGARLALCDLVAESEAAPLLDTLRSQSLQCSYRCVDVAEEEEVGRWIDEVNRTLGVPSLVIPCAAVVSRSGLRGIAAQEWRRDMRINVDGVFHVTRAAALRMVSAQVRGRIVFVGSWVAERPQPRIAAYCTSKAALRMLMKCMSLEFAPNGILVNEIAPGYVDAGLTGKTLRSDPSRRQGLVTQTPLHELTEAEEIAFHVGHLCDPRTRTVTGAVWALDGGLSLLS